MLRCAITSLALLAAASPAPTAGPGEHVALLAGYDVAVCFARRTSVPVTVQVRERKNPVFKGGVAWSLIVYEDWSAVRLARIPAGHWPPRVAIECRPGAFPARPFSAEFGELNWVRQVPGSLAAIAAATGLTREEMRRVVEPRRYLARPKNGLPPFDVLGWRLYGNSFLFARKGDAKRELGVRLQLSKLRPIAPTVDLSDPTLRWFYQ